MKAEELLDVCRDAVRRARAAGAEQAEVYAVASLESRVNLEADDVSSAQSDEEERFGIRVRARGATGFAATNDPARASIGAAIASALALARVSPPDPWGDLPAPRAVAPVAGLCDPALEELGVEAIARLVGELAGRTRALDARVRIDSGSVSVSVASRALASSQGIEICERGTDAGAVLFGMAVDGERVGSFDVEHLAVCSRAELMEQIEGAPARFVERVVSSLEPGEGETFRGTLVLSHDAVAEFLLPALVSSLSAQSVRTGRSRLAGRIGERIAPPSFGLLDDGTLAGRPGSASFDREGLPHRPLALVERGELRSFLWNTHEAHALARDEGSTGHGAGGTQGPPAIGPTNLLVAPGDLDERGLVAEVERGILLRRFSGNSDPVSGDFSGVAKGSFLLRRGEPPRAVQETLISGNVYDLLAALSGVGRELRWIGGSLRTPMLRLEGVSVTAG
jgi:PmbA protein